MKGSYHIPPPVLKHILLLRLLQHLTLDHRVDADHLLHLLLRCISVDRQIVMVQGESLLRTECQMALVNTDRDSWVLFM